MKRLTPNIRKLMKLKRHQYHPIIHKIHETRKISRKTLFYIKEYGTKSHVTSVILKESLIALVIAFAIGLVSGVSLQTIQSNFAILLPLIILLPALNDMIGDYSMIMVSRLSTLVFTKGERHWWSEDLKKLVRTIVLVAVLSSVYIGIASSLIAYLKGFPLNLGSIAKLVEISLVTTAVMITVVSVVSALGVFYVYKRKEDPNNLVMPIMTSVADLGTILIFALVIRLIL